MMLLLDGLKTMKSLTIIFVLRVIFMDWAYWEVRLEHPQQVFLVEVRVYFLKNPSIRIEELGFPPVITEETTLEVPQHLRVELVVGQGERAVQEVRQEQQEQMERQELFPAAGVGVADRIRQPVVWAEEVQQDK
jgi:hypothetical protein